MDMRAMMKREIEKARANRQQPQGPVQPPMVDIDHLGLVMRGCTLAECGQWQATGRFPVGAEHPTGTSLSRGFYSSNADWKAAIKTSIGFTRALKAEAILIVRGCGLKPAENAETYKHQGGVTLRKKNIPENGSAYVNHLNLSTCNDDQAADWVVNIVAGL